MYVYCIYPQTRNNIEVPIVNLRVPISPPLLFPESSLSLLFSNKRCLFLNIVTCESVNLSKGLSRVTTHPRVRSSGAEIVIKSVYSKKFQIMINKITPSVVVGWLKRFNTQLNEITCQTSIKVTKVV